MINFTKQYKIKEFTIGYKEKTINFIIGLLFKNIMDYLKTALKDITAGSFAGICSCLAGHSFDTIKVSMMVSKQPFLKTTKSILYQHGFKGYFRGIYYPLVTIPTVNAIVFFSYQLCKRLVNFKNQFAKGFYSGAFAGTIASFIVGPVQNIKCRMQTAGKGQFSSSYQCLIKTYKRQGFVQGVMKGTVATLARDLPGYAATFAVYQQGKHLLIQYNNRKQASVIDKIIAGIASGVACAIISHPQDVIKTKIQLKSKKLLGWDGGFFKQGQTLYKNQGWKAFIRGIQPQLIRQPLISVILFLGYEYFQKNINGRI